MRAELARRFDVVVVVWVLALAVGFSFALLSHSRLSPDQWTDDRPASHWVYQDN